jgi:hypothetical protein
VLAAATKTFWCDSEHDAPAGAEAEAPAGNALRESHRPTDGSQMLEISLKSPIMIDR